MSQRETWTGNHAPLAQLEQLTVAEALERILKQIGDLAHDNRGHVVINFGDGRVSSFAVTLHAGPIESYKIAALV